ncbi:MAG TPA: DUF1365 domain-containing protein, partial [Candidatus Cybelea sp.]|nr:DUF1365 domain-containing protein [Candidatus Cybelea sp.]
MADSGPAIYFGRVMHQRLRPFRHRFVYRVFSLYVDIDRLRETAGQLKLLSYNRANLFGFHDRDHGPRDGAPLRPWVERELSQAGIRADWDRIMLLCFPRLFGYVFNPLSIFFCHDRQNRLRAILYEVKNTFGEQHAYAIEVRDSSSDCITQTTDKRFYVSPFIDMKATYHFRLSAPGDRLSVGIRQTVAAGELLVAVHQGRRAPLSDRALLKGFLL